MLTFEERSSGAAEMRSPGRSGRVKALDRRRFDGVGEARDAHARELVG
jgi:hypothetical protein